MAMQACRECQTEVSTEAQACPHCGAAMPTRERSISWTPCPKCGSAKTQQIGRGLMGFGSLVMGSCLLWIPVIGWILAPIFFLAAVALWVSAALPSAKVSFHCQSCKQWFTIPKSELARSDAGVPNRRARMATKIPTWLGAVILVAIAVAILAIRTGNTPESRAPTSQRPTAPVPAPVRRDWELVRTQGMMKLVHVAKTKEADRAVYQDAIRSLCRAGEYCFISFWSTRALVPARLPMSDAEAKAQVASYTRNPSTGLDEFLLTCRIEKDRNKCF